MLGPGGKKEESWRNARAGGNLGGAGTLIRDSAALETLVFIPLRCNLEGFKDRR